MRTILRGKERVTLELDGTLPARARDLVPAPLEVGAGGVRVNLLLFAMEGLRMRGVPWPRFDYREALWRIDVTYQGAAGWFALACDLDSAPIRVLGRRLVRYPTRAARIDEAWSVETDSAAFACSVDETTSTPTPLAARRTFVVDDGTVFEVPWHEIAAPTRQAARVDVTTDTLAPLTFGHAVEWAGEGTVHRGRLHHCGVATRLA
jgi:hypothetical protein